MSENNTDSYSDGTEQPDWTEKPVAPPEDVRPVVQNGRLYRPNAIVSTIIGPLGREHVDQTSWDGRVEALCGLEFRREDSADKVSEGPCPNCKRSAESKWGYQPFGNGFGTFIDTTKIRSVWTNGETSDTNSTDTERSDHET